MATIVFAWQLGGGLGHLMRCLPLATGLVARGHTVYLAAKHLGRAAGVFAAAGVRFLQAPVKAPGPGPCRRCTGYGQLLGNSGFGDDAELFGLASAWRNLLRLTRADLLVADHSPVALLAARGLTTRRVAIGPGFCCPPDADPLPILRADATPADVAAATAAEAAVLRRANWVLGHWDRPPMTRLAQLYADADDCLLTTFPELDHFGARGGARYRGHVGAEGGDLVPWPAGVAGRPRVFAYLKAASPGLRPVLAALSRRGGPTVLYADGADRRAAEAFGSPTLVVAADRPDPRRAAAECDVAVVNAGHNLACDLLLAGKPAVLVPMHAEQLLVARAVAALGAGRVLLPTKGAAAAAEGAAVEALDDVASSPGYAAAARRFAATHAGFDPAGELRQMIDRLDELARHRPPASVFGGTPVRPAAEWWAAHRGRSVTR
jgi:UDP:flavonoid glycosyltransferase YjiC (YdhE family)